jgi:hypothetical protein
MNHTRARFALTMLALSIGATSAVIFHGSTYSEFIVDGAVLLAGAMVGVSALWSP